MTIRRARPAEPAGRALSTAATLCAILAAAGCDRRAAAPDAGHEHGDHDHDHDHGGEEADEGHAGEVRLDAAARQAFGIEIGAARRQVLVRMLRVPAQVAFDQEHLAHVGSPVHGRIAALEVRPGDAVERGDALFVVESPELGEAESDLLLKHALAAAAEPTVGVLRDAYERARALFDEKQAIAFTEVQKREVDLRAAEAALASARAANEAAANRLTLLGMDDAAIAELLKSRKMDPRIVVRAPIAGQVIERAVTLGELVGPEREMLFVLANPSRLWVLAEVPEARLKDLAVGQEARVLLGTAEDHWCPARVAFISPSLNPATRTVQVRLAAEDAHAELRPGVFAQAEIAVAYASGAEPSPVLAVPHSAVQLVDGAPGVFVPVAGEPDTFALRRVAVGPAVGAFAPIYSGLADGEAVVIAGSFILKAELGKASAEHEH